MNINQTLGEYVGNAIDSSNLTRDEIAERIGVDSSYLSKLKSNLVVPSPAVLDGFIRELNLDPEITRQLVEKVVEEKNVKKNIRYLRSALNYLKRLVPEMLASIIKEALGPSEQEDVFLENLLFEPGWGGGEHGEVQALIIDNHQEIPIDLTFGPSLNQAGEVVLGGNINASNLPPGQRALLNLEFLPGHQQLGSFPLTPEQPIFIKAKLTPTPSLKKKLEQMEKEKLDFAPLPKTAFYFWIELKKEG
jgi:transcriptional regulator with XRE-family HTH domain